MPVLYSTVNSSPRRYPLTPRRRDLNSRGITIGRLGRSGGGHRRKRDPRKIASTLAILLAAVFFAGSVSFIGFAAWISRSLPDPENLSDRSIAQTTRIYDRTGEVLLYEVHGDQKRTVVEISDVTKDALNATITAEDRDFYRHRGFSVTGIVRAVYKNVVRGGKVQGGSTITQQFIKNSILTREKTYTRKIKEVILAFEMERRFSKEQILKLYLNEIPYGSVAYGIESASRTFFGKSAKDLTLSESVVLAALPKAPTYYSPYGSHREELLLRVQGILDAMVEEGYLEAEQAEEAKKDDVLARIQPRRESIIAPHFVFHVREQLAERFGEQAVERGGLKVITTLDAEKQRFAEEAVKNGEAVRKTWKATNAALLAIDPKTGEVLSMVGSADYFNDDINGKFNVLLGERQPGSSIKPFVYAAAFEKGYTPDTVVEDVVTTFVGGPKEYRPQNYDLKEHGLVTFREALAGSLNIPAVKVLYLTGVDRFFDFAKRFGYTTFEDRGRYGLSIVLGGGEVRPIEHIAAFSAFATEGEIRPMKAILRVEDSQGEVMLDAAAPEEAKSVIEPEVARTINGILSDNAARAYIFGENNHLTLAERPVAAKTGTTNGFRDAWTIGYTPSLVAGVWIGNSDNAEMKAGADGSKIAAPVWNEFMRRSLAGKPVETFTTPMSIVTGKPLLDGVKSVQATVKIDRVTGKLATPFTPPELVEERGYGQPHTILFFIDKDDPRGPAPEHPENDQQFASWEQAVTEWASRQNVLPAEPPTEFDDVHLPENVPSVRFIQPEDASTLDSRTVYVQMDATSRRGVSHIEYYLGDEPAPISSFRYPHAQPLIIPNRFPKGFHRLTAKAFDDVGNVATTSITINLTADGGPLDIQWLTPWQGETLSAPSFPFTVSFRLGDPKAVRKITVLAVGPDGIGRYLGTVQSPPLPDISLRWDGVGPSGDWRIQIEAELTDGRHAIEFVDVDLR